MPKKANTQLAAAVEIIRTFPQPLSKEDRKSIMDMFQKQFSCSKSTAYYYYFYKASRLLAKEGVDVGRAKREKKSSTASTSEIIARLPKVSSPFASLGV